MLCRLTHRATTMRAKCRETAKIRSSESNERLVVRDLSAMRPAGDAIASDASST